MISFADKAIKYFLALKSRIKFPAEIQIINPYHKPEVKEAVKKFYTKYYNDNNTRIFILGINPGRFGGGLTGISFTDPIALRKICGIENNLGNKKELSSEFVYKVIKEYGGTEKFFVKFFLSAVYPLVILKDGKNYNYYDSKKLLEMTKTGIIESLKLQSGFGANKKIVISLGKKNGEYLKKFNEELELFERVEFLDHPRFIMQYRRKFLNKYIDEYLRILSLAE
jgi:hypothetical protein